MIEQILNDCTVEGNVVNLPKIQLDRKTYESVAKALQGIGGKWNRKANGFLFATDPTERLSQIQCGEKVNLKKEFQFFATPKEIADKLVQLACIKTDAIILEPSAGQGAIIEAIRRAGHKNNLVAIELMPENAKILLGKGIDDVSIIEGDFLAAAESHKDDYDYIIANPPFAKNQDIDHVRAMYDCLKESGTMVSIMSNHWKTSENKKEAGFREWITRLDAEIYNLPFGTFKESGTNVAACIVVIKK